MTVAGFKQGVGSTRGDPGLGLRPNSTSTLVPDTNGAPDYWPQDLAGVTVNTGAVLDDTGLVGDAGGAAAGKFLSLGSKPDIGASEFAALHPGGFAQGVGSTQGLPDLGLRPGSGATLVAGTYGAPDYYPQSESGVTVDQGAYLDDTAVSGSTDGASQGFLYVLNAIPDIGASEWSPPPPPGPLLQPVQGWDIESASNAGDTQLHLTIHPTVGNLLVATAGVSQAQQDNADPALASDGPGTWQLAATHESPNHLLIRVWVKFASANDTGVTLNVGDLNPRVSALLVHELDGTLIDRDNPLGGMTALTNGADASSAPQVLGGNLAQNAYLYAALANRGKPAVAGMTDGFSGTDADNVVYAAGGYSSVGSQAVSVHGWISRLRTQGQNSGFSASFGASTQDYQAVVLGLLPAPLGAGESGHGTRQPPVEAYRFELCDYTGSPVSELTTAPVRKLSYRRNGPFHTATVVLYLDDPVAELIEPGVTRLKVYRERGPDEEPGEDDFVFYGSLPVSGTREDTNANTIECTFADPRRVLGLRNVPAGFKAAADGTPAFSQVDQGDILWYLIDYQNRSLYPPSFAPPGSTETWMRKGVTSTGVLRDRSYDRITLDTVIKNMTEVLDGCDVDVTPYDGFALGDPTTGENPSRVMGLFNAYASQGTDKPDCTFSVGPDIHTNCKSAERTYLDFTNVAEVEGTNAAGQVVSAVKGRPDVVLGMHLYYETDQDVSEQATVDAKAAGVVANESGRREVVVFKDPLDNAPRPFAHYYLGDTVRGIVQKGRFATSSVLRVEGFDIDVDTEGVLHVEVVTSTISVSNVETFGPLTDAPLPFTPPSITPTANWRLRFGWIANPTVGTSGGGGGGGGGETFTPVVYSLWEATYYNKGLFGFTSGYNHATQVLRGTTASDVGSYGDTISEIASIDTATPTNVVTKTAHGRSNGDRVIFDGLKGTNVSALSQRSTGFYAKVVNSTTFQVYSDAALTTPYHNIGTVTPNNGITGIGVPSTWREIIITDTDNLATVGDGTPYLSGPDGSGFYTLQNIETNYLSITGPTARSKIKIRNVRVSNTNPSTNPQRVDNFTGHAEFFFCNLDIQDFHVYFGTGGAFSFSDPLKGQRLIKGGALVWSQSTGQARNFFFEQCVYDINKVTGSLMVNFTWWNGTCSRHRGLSGGGHTDCWQIAGLNNSALTVPTWKYVWMESGGNACLFFNMTAGGAVSNPGIDPFNNQPTYQRNAVAQFCLAWQGNKFIDGAASTLCGAQHCYGGPTVDMVDLGNDDPISATKATNHPMGQYVIAYDLWKDGGNTGQPDVFLPATIPTEPGPSSDPLRNPFKGTPWFYGPGPSGYGPNGHAVPDTEYDFHFFVP